MALSRAPVNPGREPTWEEKATISIAAKTDDVVTLQKLISSGVDVTGSVDDYGYNKTALHFAAQNGNNSVVSALITAGANVNAVNIDNWTALHYATYKGSNSVLSLLISAGADVNAVTAVNNTALHIAASNGRNSVVSVLITAGANVNAVNNISKRTPVHLAAYLGHTDVVAMLVANGGDVNMKDDGGDTPLDDAVSKKHSGVVSYLIQNGGIDLTKFDQEKQQKIRDLMKKEGKSTEWHKPPVSQATVQPTLPDLLTYSKAVIDWEILGILLLPNEPAEIELIKATHKDDVKKCKLALFQAYLQMGDRSWRTVANAMEKADYPHIAEKIITDFCL